MIQIWRTRNENQYVIMTVAGTNLEITTLPARSKEKITKKIYLEYYERKIYKRHLTFRKR